MSKSWGNKSLNDSFANESRSSGGLGLGSSNGSWPGLRLINGSFSGSSNGSWFGFGSKNGSWPGLRLISGSLSGSSNGSWLGFGSKNGSWSGLRLANGSLSGSSNGSWLVSGSNNGSWSGLGLTNGSESGSESLSGFGSGSGCGSGFGGSGIGFFSGSGSGIGFFSGSGSGSGCSPEFGDDDNDDLNMKPFLVPLIILAVVIVVVNSFIVTLVLRNVKLRSTCNAMLVSLAIADMTTGLVGIPLFLALHFAQDKMSPGQICLALLFLVTWFWFMSIICILHLLVIALEQYLAILKPFNHDKIVTRTSTAITLAVIWLLALGHSLVRWTWWLPLGYEFCHDVNNVAINSQNEEIYVAFTTIAFFCVPIVMLGYVYVRIVSEAKRQLGRIKRESVGKFPRLSSCTRYRGFYIIALMWLVFILCWAPYYGTAIFEAFFDKIADWLALMLAVLRFLPSVFNPIMFAFWRSDFRAACIEKICCCAGMNDQTRSFRSSMSSGKQQAPLIKKENVPLSDHKDTKPQFV